MIKQKRGIKAYSKKYVHPNCSNLENEGEEEENKEHSIKTRLFSDSFRYYQVEEFKKEGFINIYLKNN